MKVSSGGGGVQDALVRLGVPPKLSDKAKADVLLHTVIARLMPAFGRWFTPTDTVAVALPQGGVPITVYV